MLDLILDILSAALEAVWANWGLTAKQRVKRGLRLSRRRNLSAKSRQFAQTWLDHGLQNLADLGLQAREPELRTALSRVKEPAPSDPAPELNDAGRP
ncbi:MULTISPECIES: hypothetical protein [unclassified Arthrobacter]|uniref:hypothetical protein n=1 Tax=unclassified Arthrobacter TaxID=235627 RepID=UPI001DB4AA7E|nr:hypothetical protein [Arthrobacter sp. Bi26]CAH0253655.1 hypothetical protein SRABI26_03210 [Arthrobacter sp. Bi26]